MIALITGGSGALGGEICRTLARDGARVVIGCWRHLEAATAVAAEIQQLGGEARPLMFDVSAPESVTAAFETIEDQEGGLDVLVNAAGWSADALLYDLDPADAARVHAVNVLGTMHCIRAALPPLLRSRRARVVNLSSVVALRSSPGVAAYAASKGAIDSLTRALAVELGPKGITVNAVAPGYVAGGLGRGPVERAGEWLRALVPAGRAGRTQEVAAVVGFLVSEPASYVNGAIVPVDGGALAGARLPRRPSSQRWTPNDNQKVEP